MNTNIMRTILSIAAVAVMAASSIFGCVTDAAGVITCSASWMSPTTGAMVASGMVVVNLLLKAFGGVPGATVVQKLASPVVPIVPETVAGPGTVSLKQVMAK